MLFENLKGYDVQAERAKTAKEVTEKVTKEVTEAVTKAVTEELTNESIRKQIAVLQRFSVSREAAKEALVETYGLTADIAEEKLMQHWKE